MAPDFTLRQLGYFIAVARTGTTQAAAEELFVSQSALSAAIAELERALDVQLFVRRAGKSLTLSESGRKLLPSARKLLADAEDLRGEASDLQHELQGDLAVGCFEILAPSLLPRLISGFHEMHPRVRLDFIEGTYAELVEALENGRIEVAILLERDEHSGLRRSVLTTLKPHVLLPTDHPRADAEQLSLQDLDGESLIFVDAEPSQEFILRAFATAGVTPNIRFRSRNLEHVRALVRRGLGFTLVVMRDRNVSRFREEGVAAIPLSDEIAPEAIVLCQLEQSTLTRRAAAFWDYAHFLISSI